MKGRDESNLIDCHCEPQGLSDSLECADLPALGQSGAKAPHSKESTAFVLLCGPHRLR